MGLGVRGEGPVVLGPRDPLEPCHNPVKMHSGAIGTARGDCRATGARGAMQVHASCCAWGGLAVLLRGTPGSGKSDLALRLVDAGFQLVADDRVDLVAENGAVTASAPAPLAGLIEVRGLGILDLGSHVAAPLGLLADLGPATTIDRLPEPATEEVLGVRLPVIRLDPTAPSAVARVRAALAVIDGRAASRCGALGDRTQAAMP